MKLFRRTDGRPVEHPVTAFWDWWSATGQGIDPSRTSGLTDELTQRVGEIHPDLTWHFAQGSTAQHRLTVSAGGLAEVRPSAERWLRAAPPAGLTWEFRSSQEADPDAMTTKLQFAGVDLDLSLTRFRVEPVQDNLRFHVGVYHPAFELLPESARRRVTYLVLDWLLGEDGVERWVGNIATLGVPPRPEGTASDVLAAAAEASAQHDAEMWVLATGADDDRPLLASWRRGVRWLDAPTFDRHQGVAVRYKAQPNGLPLDSAVLDQLGAYEDELVELIGARGLLVAIETRDGTRTFHVYTDGEDQNVDAAIAAWARTRNVIVAAEADPGWSKVRRFTG